MNSRKKLNVAKLIVSTTLLKSSLESRTLNDVESEILDSVRDEIGKDDFTKICIELMSNKNFIYNTLRNK